MLRLFVGLPIPDPLIDRLTLLQGGIPGARWVPQANFHLTLRFVGEVDPPTAEDVDNALTRLSGDPVGIGLDGVGTFGTARSPALLFANVPRSEGLALLQRKIERALSQLGLAADRRKFHPHITLARLKNPDRHRLQRFLDDNGALFAPAVSVDRFRLYRSHLHGQGSVYQPVADYPLGDAPLFRPADGRWTDEDRRDEDDEEADGSIEDAPWADDPRYAVGGAFGGGRPR